MYQSVGTWHENRQGCFCLLSIRLLTFLQRYYDLQVIQHPIRARQSGFGDKGDPFQLAPRAFVTVLTAPRNSDILPHTLITLTDVFKEDGDPATLVLHPAFGGSATNSATTRTGSDYGGLYGSNGQRQDELPVPRHAKSITFESYPPRRHNQSWSQSDPVYGRHNPAPPVAHQEPHVPQILMPPQVPQLSQIAVLPSIRTFEALGPPNQDAIRNRPYTQFSFSDSPPSRYDTLNSGASWGSPHRHPKLQIDTTLPNLASAFGPQPQTAPAGHALQFPRATSQYDAVPMSGRSDTYTYSPLWQERQWVNGASSRQGPPSSASHWSTDGGHRNDLHASGLPSLGSALLREPALKKYSRTLIGPHVSNGVQLHDEKKREGIFFIFQDLSIRVEGVFRIRIRLFPVPMDSTIPGRSHKAENGKMLAEAWSDSFEVFSAKRFPGVPEITALSQALSAQGQKLPTRRKTEDHDDGHFDDDSRVTNAWPDDFRSTA
ncbi:hypothetical protein CALCODRAFT_505230 [Calocera cornea HHB12733]|uniref:Velvet domain-containing protein n=1 Tax=Calocera cornea HHB12733 TaxID=1353952 RepID=A0A165K7P4_9BASI|nr:hypothetical protein CALCODRAFT_505230 [Calocera cornea HHB12733]